MAGIGFELRRLLDRHSLWGLARAYAYAGVVSSGPWVLSIIGVMGIGLFSVGRVPPVEVRQFLVTVTYVMAASLIATGGLQLMFARFIADCLYRREEDRVLPNLLGALTLTGVAMGALSIPLLFVLAGPLAARVLTLMTLIVLSGSWIAVVLLSSLRDYRGVVFSFLVGYAISVAGALALRPFGLVGLLAGFLCGQTVLVVAMVGLVARRYPTRTVVAFDLLDRRRAHLSLAATGFLYNLGIWIDKLIFWFTPSTSESVLGPLRASVIYDIPIFLAYLSIVPGMAVFLVRVETSFAEEYDGFFAAVRDGETLANIRHRRDRLTLAVKHGISDIFKVQGITVLILLLAAPRLLAAVGISHLYQQLFSVDVAGVALQVLMLAVFNVLFYLDHRRTTLALAGSFCLLNAGLTVAAQHAGPPFYGYGFALSTAIISLVGLLVASRKLDRLEADTFMRVA